MEDFVVIVLGALGATGVKMWTRVRLAWGRLRMLGTLGVVLACLMSAAAEPPEKPIPKALPVADDEPQAKPLKRMMEEADKELAQKDKSGAPQKAPKEETPLTRYYKLVISQVEKKWHMYLRLRPEGMTTGGLELVFYVNKKGGVEDLKVINDKGSTPVLTEVTKRAIKDAVIPPIPAEVIPLLPKDDPQRLKITFNVLVY